MKRSRKTKRKQRLTMPCNFSPKEEGQERQKRNEVTERTRKKK